MRMNEIVSGFLLVGDKFMTEMHLKQPGFTYSVCGSFTINKERTKTFDDDPKLQMIQNMKDIKKD